MAKCVEIMIDDNGVIQVYECSPREEQEEGYDKQEVGSIDEALSAAKMLLGGENSDDAEETAAFDGVFAKQKMMES